MKEAGDEKLAFKSLLQQSKLIFSKLVMISFSHELLAILSLGELMFWSVCELRPCGLPPCFHVLPATVSLEGMLNKCLRTK